MTVKKQPTLASLLRQGISFEEMETQGLETDESFQTHHERQVFGWIGFWLTITILSYVGLWIFGRKRQLVDFMKSATLTVSFILMGIVAIFGYSNYVLGTRPILPLTAYTSGKGAIEVEVQARDQMFSRFLGPLVGIAFIVLLSAIDVLLMKGG
ncbi:MAG: hypothetical protein D6732_07425 [Methanobacteriota archaeon]|nr:MAG: hypothetical protein D6732_07425 [Euryarchaeota archaeon]